MKFEVPENSTKHRIKEGLSLDRATVEFKDTDGKVVDKADATEVVTEAVVPLEGPIE